MFVKKCHTLWDEDGSSFFLLFTLTDTQRALCRLPDFTCIVSALSIPGCSEYFSQSQPHMSGSSLSAGWSRMNECEERETCRSLSLALLRTKRLNRLTCSQASYRTLAPGLTKPGPPAQSYFLYAPYKMLRGHRSHKRVQVADELMSL